MIQKNLVKIIFLFALCMQMIFSVQLKNTRASIEILPDIPNKTQLKLNSLGDDEFYFRILAFFIQNAGDQFGDFTPLKQYNYSKLKDWFFLLDELNSKSHLVPAIASYYYSQTQNIEDLRYIISYLENHFNYDKNTNWWWLYQAIYIANYKLKDKDLSLRLAMKLAQEKNSNMPLWVKQMPAFILEQMGETQQALIVIENILNDVENISDLELDFMHYFLTQRLKVSD